MALSATLLLCLSLALVALAHGFPQYLTGDEEGDFRENEDVGGLLGDVEEDGMIEPAVMLEGQDEMADTGDGGEPLSAQDRLLAMYERDRRGARWNKNFVGISSLDRSLTSYTSFLPCRVEGICKKQFKQTFRCKCNRHTYCVGPGRKYAAKCRYSAVGHVFYQP